MNEPIKAGDLVVIVARGPCGCGGAIGKIFVVAKLEMTEHNCSACKTLHPSMLCAWIPGKHQVVPLYRLKRIDPLPKEDEIESGRELTI